jgi:hypothetical protein
MMPPPKKSRSLLSGNARRGDPWPKKKDGIFSGVAGSSSKFFLQFFWKALTSVISLVEGVLAERKNRADSPERSEGILARRVKGER